MSSQGVFLTRRKIKGKCRWPVRTVSLRPDFHSKRAQNTIRALHLLSGESTRAEDPSTSKYENVVQKYRLY